MPLPHSWGGRQKEQVPDLPSVLVCGKGWFARRRRGVENKQVPVNLDGRWGKYFEMYWEATQYCTRASYIDETSKG